MHPTLRIHRLPAAEGLPLPRYETAGAAGLDLRAALPDETVTIAPGRWAIVPTGLRIAIPDGYEGQIRARSGMALRSGYRVHPGTLDADYRGPVGVLVFAPPHDSLVIAHGERIAQLVVAPVARVEVAEVESLDETGRVGGFGSTGAQ